MSNNMTRKGLAFGAGFALVASGLAAAPAQADGLTGLISLNPTSGPASALAITAGTGQDFSLTAQPAATVGSSGNMKFLVTDPERKFNPYVGGLLDDGAAIEYPNSAASLGAADDTETVALAADGTVTITTTHAFTVGDRIEFSANVVTDGGYTLLTDDKLYRVATVTGTAAFTIEEAAEAVEVTLAAGDGDIEAVSTDADPSVVTVTDGNNKVDPLPFEVGDTVQFSADLENTDGVLSVAGADVVLKANTDGDTLVFDTIQASRNFTDDAAGLINETNVQLVRAVADGVANDVDIRILGDENSSGQFVVDSGVSDGSAISLDLRQEDGLARTVTVQAWVDTFADGVIGDTEYVSDPVTLTFIPAGSVSATTTLAAPAAGDDTLTATIVTDPLINISQDENTDLIKAVFTRQGSTTNGLSADADSTQNAVTGVVTATITTAITADNIQEWIDGDADGTGTDTDNGEWSDANGILAVPSARAAGAIGAVSVTAAKVASVTTDAAHNLRTGDKITYAAADIAAMNETAATVTVTGATTFTYPLSETGDVTAATDADEEAGGYTVVTNGAGVSLVERVFAGDYSAHAVVETAGGYKKVGTASARGTQSLAAADTVFTTVASTTLQGAVVKNDADDTDTDARILAGTTSVEVVATIVDKDGDAVSEGRRVDYTIERGAFTTIKVNDRTSGTSLTTDANGQVKFTVTDTTGADGRKVTIKATPEGVAAAATYFTLEWDKAAFTLVDLNTTASEIGSAAGDRTEVRRVAPDTSYVVDLLVGDQWYTAADDAKYRVKVTGQGVTEGFVAINDGRASVTIADAGVDTNFNTVLTLEEDKSGTWTKVVAKTVNTIVVSKSGLLLAANASALYDGSTADLSDAVASTALVERDTRQAFASKPNYLKDDGGSVAVTGKAVNSSTGVSLAGSVVTISGPSNILFEHGALDVAARGSLTFLADATDGEFTVDLYSTTAQKDTVITVTSNGVSKEVKVTFTGQGVGEGTVLTIDTPANVAPAGTFQVKANLADAFGNGVDTSADRMRVTYSGPGIYFGTLPTETDSNGDLTFSVLLGANDTGTITVTVSYDQNGDGDFVDAKDLTTTKTITVGESSTQKVNAGSFKGYVAVYALGYEGQRLSAKIGNDWVIVDPIVNNESANLARVTDFTGAGVDIAVRIYIDRVLVDTIPLVTK